MSTSQNQNQNQDEIKILPESREFKLIRTIPRDDSIKYYLFKNYIELEHILFQNSPTKCKEELFDEINSILESNQYNQNKLLCYLIDLLLYFILIRPKMMEIPCFLLTSLHSKYTDKQKFIQDSIKMNEYYNKYLSNINQSQEFNLSQFISLLNHEKRRLKLLFLKIT